MRVDGRRRRHTYASVHENEIHLHEGENHLQQWIDAAQNLMAWRSEWNLEECTDFQSNIDHCAQAESCRKGRIYSSELNWRFVAAMWVGARLTDGTDTQEEASVAWVVMSCLAATNILRCGHGIDSFDSSILRQEENYQSKWMPEKEGRHWKLQMQTKRLQLMAKSCSRIAK